MSPALATDRYTHDGTMHVLRLSGSPREMAHQHGSLLREAIARGPLHHYRHYVRRTLRRSGLGWLTPIAWSLLRLLVGRRVRDCLPPEVRAAAEGLAAGAGIPLAQVLDACTMPDVLLWLAARLQRRLPRATAHRLALGLGCSSALAWGRATADGKLLHARNFDYHGVGCWDRETAVIFYEPDDGQPYVSVAAAGVFLGGVTAMNSAGLTLTMHQHMFSDGTRLGGTPAGAVGARVMREARDLDEAEAILEEHTPIGCFSYVVGDARRREVLCYEENPDRGVALRYGSERPDAVEGAPDTFRYTNIYIDPPLAATEKDLYPSYWRHNQGRWRRLEEQLRAGWGSHGAESLAGIMGATGEEDGCRLREAIAMLLTVGSVVFRPEDGSLWVASGEAPVSRQPYRPFSLAKAGPAPELGELRPVTPGPGDEAFAAYKRAYLAFFEREDPAAARRALAEALRLAPREACYHAVGGLLALVEGDLLAAEEALRAALGLGHPDAARVAGFRLWLGWVLDLAGRRQEACAAYREALAAPEVDGPVRAAAREGLRRAFPRRRARKLSIEFSFADVIRP